MPDGEEKKWLEWVDNHLVPICRSTSEALESFDYIATHGNFSLTERFRLVAKYPGEAAMPETWVDALKGRDYLGGSEPNLADLAVFDVLRPNRYLTSGKDMVKHTRIGEWYSRMENAVGEPA
ncbi:Glutathione S-transferase family protein isoform 2 [Hibiscus syriacus]|uniref:Glutathione S-transferase family protein isoform 2 n=1 Tax=Hibiscus syriacus TaxID=106335 RepID=A0A6A2X3H5_HIBSY|nr:Glutathione S-transferase family protein isoform 2 [Hibiscus syriacus]